MFDDPKKELQRLEDELLLEEYEEEYDESEDYEEEEDPDLIPIYRNHANNYGANVRNYANGYGVQEDYDEEEYLDDSAGIFVDEKEEKKKRREQRGMVFMAILDLILIGFLVWWWLSWRQ